MYCIFRDNCLWALIWKTDQRGWFLRWRWRRRWWGSCWRCWTRWRTWPRRRRGRWSRSRRRSRSLSRDFRRSLLRPGRAATQLTWKTFPSMQKNCHKTLTLLVPGIFQSLSFGSDNVSNTAVGKSVSNFTTASNHKRLFLRSDSPTVFRPFVRLCVSVSVRTHFCDARQEIALRGNYWWERN